MEGEPPAANGRPLTNGPSPVAREPPAKPVLSASARVSDGPPRVAGVAGPPGSEFVWAPGEESNIVVSSCLGVVLCLRLMSNFSVV